MVGFMREGNAKKKGTFLRSYNPVNELLDIFVMSQGEWLVVVRSDHWSNVL
jgi:hypothetical protein